MKKMLYGTMITVAIMIVLLYIVTNGRCIMTANELTEEYVTAEYGIDWNVVTNVTNFSKDPNGRMIIHYEVYLLGNDGKVKYSIMATTSQHYMRTVTGNKWNIVLPI